MGVYAIAAIPLLLMMLEITENLPEKAARMPGYADDFTAGGTTENIKICWDTLNNLGPKFGYFPNPSKTWSIVKEKFEERAANVSSQDRHQDNNKW